MSEHTERTTERLGLLGIVASLEKELQTALDDTDYWIAEVANRGKVVQEQAHKIAQKDDHIEELEADVNRMRTLALLDLDARKELEAALEQGELVRTRLRTSWREDTADLGDFDAALHSAFQDYRDDFPDSSIEDFDKWLACHVECGQEMLAP